tara:strand:+ start:839 stop:1450 length:612 start_codon:yes stop_codon:yes gene_type:complete
MSELKLKVNETFYSLQGEGFRAGSPSFFVRLTGCDLTCGFCDTEFVSGVDMSLPDIYRKIRGETICKWIIFTGGEPLLQLTPDILKFFNEKGYAIAVETNGNNKVTKELRDNIDWLVVSPKVANHVIEKNFKDVWIDEYRLVRHKGHTSLSVPDKVRIDTKYVSPVFNGNDADLENIKHCIKLCLQQPEWNLSLQTHKLLQIL